MNGLHAERQLRVAPDALPIRGGFDASANYGRANVVPLFPDPDASRDAVTPPGNGSGEPLVLRPALFERLARAGRVTTVSAPAGSGKTRLLSSWIAEAEIGRQTAWATVAREEYDGQRFWASVTDALERIEEPAVLVIDDLHELQSADALASLERFLTDLPGSLRVVLLARGNPRVRLHRLRLAGDLTELRAADMRFSLQETHALLTASGIALSDAGTAETAQVHGGMGRRAAAGDDLALGAP